MIRLLIGGDFCPHKDEAFEENKFHGISEIIRNTDYSIVNLECPLDLKGDKKPIKKIGPSLRASSTSASILKKIDIKAVSLANNHFKDFGKEGCEDTFKFLSDNNIDYVGGGIDLKDARKTLFKEIGNTTIAIINCCEEEFSIANDNEAGSNPINPINQYYDILKAKESADIVIVIVHGGIEMYNLPSPKMQELYRFFIDCGADLVVNHHQHCYSGMEWYNGKAIYYGLGNLYFPSLGKSSKAWSEGFILLLTIENKVIKEIEPIPYRQSYEQGIIIGDTFGFKKSFNVLNLICGDPKIVCERYETFIDRDIMSYNVINPYNNKILRGAARRGWLPSLVSRKSYLELLGKIKCQSHYDRLVNFLEQKVLK